MRRQMQGVGIALVVALAACEGPADAPEDAGAVDADAGVTDAYFDPAPDASPCGLLGLPGPPRMENVIGPLIQLQDLDGDGTPELISIVSNSVSVLQSNGDGSFGSAVTSAIPGGGPPRTFALGDVDGDTIIDLVVASAPDLAQMVDSAVIVMRGDGTGAFEEMGTYAVDTEAVSLVDLDGDTKLDLLYIDESASSAPVAIRINAGDGSFGAQTSYPLMFPASSIATADVNGDDIADVVAIATNLNVLLGVGDGTLQSPDEYPLPSPMDSSPTQIALVDLDEDQDVDVLFGQLSTLIVFFNDGAGALSPTPSDYSEVLPPTYGGHGVVTGDLNEDGHADAVLYNAYGLLPLFGDGTGALEPQHELLLEKPLRVLVSDFMETSAPELVLTSLSNYAVVLTVLANDGAGGFGLTHFMVGDVAANAVESADLNHDGHEDLLLFDNVASSMTVALGQSGGTFSAKSPLGFTGALGPFVIRDMNSDGVLDLIAVVTTDQPQMSILFGNGDGSYRQDDAPTFSPMLWGGGKYDAGDFNGDGLGDVVVTAGENMSLYMASATGTFTPVMIDKSPNGAWFDALAIADLNRDGALDVVATYRQACVECAQVPPGTHVLLNSGSGAFTAIPPGFSGGSSGRILVSADLNGDSIPDLVDLDAVHLGNGDGSFQAGIVYEDADAGLVHVADLTSDGTLDIATVMGASPLDPPSVMRIHAGRGDGTFDPPLVYPILNGLRTFADIDHDGRLDVVSPHDATFDVQFSRCIE